jgi:predicted lipid-binding transport protein (Tim44 family)
MTPGGGRRGSRSEARPLRPTPAVREPSPPPPPTGTAAPAAPRAQPARDWIGPLVGLTVGALLGRLVGGLPHVGLEAVVLAAVLAALAWVVLRRRSSPPSGAPVVVVPAPPHRPAPVRLTALDQGVLALRRTDPGFDATRFAGYAAMTFRDVQSARMARDPRGLRGRVTGVMYAELESGCDRLRASGRSARYAEMEVCSEVTEAWQDGDRDYLTAFVDGSMVSQTVDDATGRVVDGLPGTPTPVEAFLTFTRPAGLNFWTLSLIQGA